MTHHIKILPIYFRAVRAGTKTFEVRLNDRNYHVGDTLVLDEWSLASGFTGREERRVVTYMLTAIPGLMPDWCVMGMVPETPGAYVMALLARPYPELVLADAC